MIAPHEFQQYLQSIRDASRNFQWEVGDRYISTLAEVSLRVETSTSSTAKPQEEQKEKQEQFAVLEGVRKYALEHVLLVGKPGSGKTTSLRQLLWEDAERCMNAIEQSQSEIPPIPILIELRNLSGSVLAEIQDKLSWWLNLDENILKSLLRNQRLLILLDGLNELPNDQAWKEIDQFRQLCTNLSVPLVITTRDLGSSLVHGDITRLEMSPLTELQGQDFVHKRLPETGGELLRHIQGRLKDLAETPLLLQMLCEVFMEKGEIPKSRGELFRKEFARRYEKFKPERLRNISENSRRLMFDLLCHLAFAMVQGEPHTDPCRPTASWITISKTEAARILAKFAASDRPPTLEDMAKAKEWLEDLVEWHLLQIASDAEHIEFHHQLFQEYYAAELLVIKLTSLTDEQLKHHYLNYLKWTETLMMSMPFVESEALIVRVIKLALEVDLLLGAQLSSEVQAKQLQQKVANIIVKNVEQSLNSSAVNRTNVKNLEIYILSMTQSRFVLNKIQQNYGKDQNLKVRITLANVLHKFGEPATYTLSKLTKDLEPEVRKCAAISLGEIPSEKSLQELDKLLKDSNPEVRGCAINSLSTLLIRMERKGFKYSNLFLKELNFLLKDKDIEVCRYAVVALGRLSVELGSTKPIYSKKFLDKIDQFLQYSNPQITKYVIKVLREIGLIQIVRKRPDLLKVEVNIEEEKFSIAQNLADINSSEAVDELIKALHNEDFYVRKCAVYGLSRTGSVKKFSYLENAASALIKILKDPKNRKIRNLILMTLGNLGSENSVDILIQILLNEKEMKMSRYRACQALGKIGLKKAQPALVQILRGSNFGLRKSAISALKNILGEEDLIRVLEDEDLDNEVNHVSNLDNEADNKNHVYQQPSEEEIIKLIDGLIQDAYDGSCDDNEVVSTLSKISHLPSDVLLAEKLSYLQKAWFDTGEKRLKKVLFIIRDKCRFYNYEIAQFSQANLQENETTEDLLSTINKTTQATYEKVNQMADQPKVQMIFNDRVENAVGNVEGDVVINSAPSQEANTAIPNLLNNLRQKYPNATDEEIYDILLRGFQAMPQKNSQNWKRWQDILSVFFSGGVEATKVLFPVAGIPIEVLKRLYEIYNHNRKQLPGS